MVRKKMAQGQRENSSWYCKHDGAGMSIGPSDTRHASSPGVLKNGSNQSRF